MAAPTTFPGDVHISGSLTCGSFTPSSGSVTNASVSASAAVQASKLEHQYQPVYRQNGSASSVTETIHVGYGATGDIIAFRAGSVAIAVGAATVTVDLKKNGTTCLSGVITLDSGNTAYTPEAGTLTTTTYVAGDVFTIVTVATAGGGTLPTGLFVQPIFREDAAP